MRKKIKIILLFILCFIATTAYCEVSIIIYEHSYCWPEDYVDVGPALLNGPTYTWDFGDGSAQYISTSSFTHRHYYALPGKYTIKLTTTNGGINNGTSTKQITVSTCVAPSSSGILYVDSADVNNTAANGSSWQNALPQLADALIAADSLNTITPGTVKQIWVAKGTYKPMYKAAATDINGNPTANSSKSFVLIKDVQIYGGFGGTEISLSQRNASMMFTTHATILSGLLGNGDTAYHVVISAGDVGTVAIDGFIIKGGNADGNDDDKLMNGLITYNKDGGGAYIEDSNPLFIDCRFEKNKASNYGGGIYNESSSPSLTDCSLSSNEAQVEGGGMINEYYSSPILTNCIFSGNDGGGMNNRFSSPVLTNCTFSGNEANSPFTANGIYNQYASFPVIRNSIIEGNAPTVLNVNNAMPVYDYSLIDTVFYINNNTANSIHTSVNQLFTDTAAGNYMLRAGAWPINKGNNAYYSQDSLPYISANTTDLAGNPRIFDGIVDLGAYEYQGYPDSTMITSQPRDSTVCSSNNMTFGVTATGANLHYQWQSSSNGVVWNNITGGTANTLYLPNPQPADSGTNYRAVVTGDWNTDTSASAKLSVLSPDVFILAQPKNDTVCVGSNATFNVVATGTYLNYQWYSSTDGTTWNSVNNGYNPTLYLSSLPISVNGMKYRILVGGTCAMATSNTVTLFVKPLPTITITSGTPNPISKGIPAQLTASGAQSYQWANDPGIQSGWNEAIMTIRPEQDATYTVTGTSAEGCSSQQTYNVNIAVDYKLICNNIVTPNGDGINDTWIIQNIDSYPDNKVMIFDQAGRMVYEKENYDNQWNGTLNGGPLREGTYYYVFTVNGGKKVFKGYIELLNGQR